MSGIADEDDLASALLATVVPQFESELGPEERRWLTRETAQVYVERCRGKPQSKLEKMFSAAVSWRIERRELLSSRDSPHVLRGDLQSHDARIFGQDGDGDCVIMNCFALSRDYSPRGVSDHLACLFERAIGEFPKEAQGKGRLRWTWVIDVHGFGLQHTDPRVSLEMVTLLECAYVDRLKRLLIVDAPSIFFSLWRVVRPLLREETVKKVEFVSWDAAAGRYTELFGDELGERIRAEGIENRDSAIVKDKRWEPYYAPELLPR